MTSLLYRNYFSNYKKKFKKNPSKINFKISKMQEMCLKKPSKINFKINKMQEMWFRFVYKLK